MKHRDAIFQDAVHIYHTSQDDLSRGNYGGIDARMQYLLLEVLLDIREIVADQAGYIILPPETEEQK